MGCGIMGMGWEGAEVKRWMDVDTRIYRYRQIWRHPSKQADRKTDAAE